MSITGFADAPPDPIRILQPCSGGCTCFRALPDGHSPDFGLCLNPLSPLHGYPTRVDQDCPYYQPSQLPDKPHAG
ncbi:MAG: hypothetical protein HYX71_05825 [Opitutae bacterium]|nr:hypothetical protein [Opitutae bacterium]